MTVRDDQGNKLNKILLQVMDSDEQGPRTLVVRRDHETIDLKDPKARKFLMVWVPEDQVLGELRLTDVIEEFDNLKALVTERQAQKEQLDRDIANIRRDMTALELDNKTKTEELRVLQKERDPERVARAVQDGVAARTSELESEVQKRRCEITDLQREVEELKVSKRRLKEANERLKKGK